MFSKGKITNIDNAELKTGYYLLRQYSIKRLPYIGDVLYTVSESKIKMNSLLDLSEINQLNIGI